MKKHIILLFMIIPFLGISQESADNRSKISIGLNFSPNYSYRTLKGPSESQDHIDFVNESFHPSFGFNTGISANYQISNKFDLGFGVEFSRYATSFSDSLIIRQPENNKSTQLDIDNRNHYLEIPLCINYKVTNKNLKVYLTGGISTNLYLNNKTTSKISYEDGSSETITNQDNTAKYNKVGFALLGGIGCEYSISEKINIGIEPLYRQFLTSLTDSEIKQYNYSIGCQIKMRIKL